MVFINKLTGPGGIKRMELYPDEIRIILWDKTRRVYTNAQVNHRECSDFGYLDAAADAREDSN